jgi:eukaryotic-like serine/threonine-protein kinase
MKTCPTCQRQYGEELDFCPEDGMKLRINRKSGADPMIGRVLDGRWYIEEKIGEGGMGAVYRGHQRSVDRKVAVKTLRPSLSDNDAFIDRFFREARIATTINHPHCVTILDFGQDDDETLYLAMEFLEGTTLSARMVDPMTVEQILKIGQQIASALSAAHQAHIVHRDLKPDNIFLVDIAGGGTFIKVLDFGIAKVLNSETQFTQTGQIFGTPDYMSPEQCQGTQLDGRADLYALGCILYELFGGRPPFRRDTPMAVLMAHVFESVEPMPRRVPAAVEHLVMKLLAKDPDERYPDASAVRTSIEELLATLDSSVLAYVPGQAVSTTLDLNKPIRQATPPVQARPPVGETEETHARKLPSSHANDDEDEFGAPPSASKMRSLLAMLIAAIVIAGLGVVYALRSGEADVPPVANAITTQVASDEAPVRAGVDSEPADSAPEASPAEDAPPADDEPQAEASADEPSPAPVAQDTRPATSPATKTSPAPSRSTPPRTAPAAPEEPSKSPTTVLRDTQKILEDFSREVEEIERTVRTRPPVTEPAPSPSTVEQDTDDRPRRPARKKRDEEKLFDFFGD